MSNLSDQTKQKYRQALEDLFNGTSGFVIIYNKDLLRSDNVLIDIQTETMAQIIIDILWQISEDKHKVGKAIAQEDFKNYINKFCKEKE